LWRFTKKTSKWQKPDSAYTQYNKLNYTNC
jgi:hypothetical protein